jgi:chemotaxis protein MotB
MEEFSDISVAKPSGLIRAGIFGIALFLAILWFASAINNWLLSPEDTAVVDRLEGVEREGDPETPLDKKLENLWFETRAMLETELENKRRLIAVTTSTEAAIAASAAKVVQAENSVTLTLGILEQARADLETSKAKLVDLERNTPETALETAQLAMAKATEAATVAQNEFERARSEQKRTESTVAELRRAAEAADAAATASRLVVSAAESAQQAVSDNQDVMSDTDSQTFTNLENDFFNEARQQADDVARSSKAAQKAVVAAGIRLKTLKKQETEFQKRFAAANETEKAAISKFAEVKIAIQAHLQKLLTAQKENEAAKLKLETAQTTLGEENAALKLAIDNTKLLKTRLEEAKQAIVKAEKTQSIAQEKFKETEDRLKKLHRKRSEETAVLTAALNATLNERLREPLLGATPDYPIFDRIVFSSAKLFAAGSSDLEPKGQELLLKAVPVLSDLAATVPEDVDWVLRVDGHTDNQPLSGNGRFKDNWELSQARALSVVRFFVRSAKIEPHRLSANGYGEFQPLVEGDTERVWAINRRIELALATR